MVPFNTFWAKCISTIFFIPNFTKLEIFMKNGLNPCNLSQIIILLVFFQIRNLSHFYTNMSGEAFTPVFEKLMINYKKLEYILGTLGHSGFGEVASLEVCLVWTSVPTVWYSLM